MYPWPTSFCQVIELSSVTTAADIWSIGCLIVELLTGSAPYFDCQPLSALFRIVQDKHPPLPQGISDSLRSFLLSCFIKVLAKHTQMICSATAACYRTL